MSEKDYQRRRKTENKRLRRTENYIIEFAQDFVQGRQYEKYVTYLFTFTPGTWISVAEIYKRYQEEPPPEPDTLFESVLKHTNLEEIQIVWMHYPYDMEGMCTIVFFWQETYKSTVALYNKTRLDKLQ